MIVKSKDGIGIKFLSSTEMGEKQLQQRVIIWILLKSTEIYIQLKILINNICKRLKNAVSKSKKTSASPKEVLKERIITLRLLKFARLFC